MSKSFFNDCKDADLAAGSKNFAEAIGAAPEVFGISPQLAAAYADLDARWQVAYAETTNPGSRTRSAVSEKNHLRGEVIAMASSLAKIISANPGVSDGQRIELGLSVRDAASPLPPPGKPERLKVALDGDGSLILTWACDNPKGSRGTTYEIYRQLDGGERIYLATTGQKRFRDYRLPRGATAIVYHLRAARSTKFGAWTQFPVSIGGGGPNWGEMPLAA